MTSPRYDTPAPRWPLPLLATTTGGRTPDGYCPACLDLWQHGRTDEHRATMHPACRTLLEVIHATPSQPWDAP